MDTDGAAKQMEIERAIEIIPDLSDRFSELQSLTGEQGDGPWSRCRYTVNRDGSFDTEFSRLPPDWAE